MLTSFPQLQILTYINLFSFSIYGPASINCYYVYTYTYSYTYIVPNITCSVLDNQFVYSSTGKTIYSATNILQLLLVFLYLIRWFCGCYCFCCCFVGFYKFILASSHLASNVGETLSIYCSVFLGNTFHQTSNPLVFFFIVSSIGFLLLVFFCCCCFKILCFIHILFFTLRNFFPNFTRPLWSL